MKYNRVKFSASLSGMPKRTLQTLLPLLALRTSPERRPSFGLVPNLRWRSVARRKKTLLLVRRAPGKLCLPDIAKKEAGYFSF